MRKDARGIPLVTVLVLGTIAIGVLVVAATGASTVRPVPGTPTARLVESVVLQSEAQLDVAPGTGTPPTVSYVVTTAARAWAFLSGLRWSTGGYTTGGCTCVPQTTLPPPGVATQPAPIDLLTDPEPVALVEVSGVQFLALQYHFGGPVCLLGTCPAPPSTLATAQEADVDLVVVDLRNGQISGGTLATPPTGSSFTLSNFGPVTSWTGPSSFQHLPEPVRVVPIDSPTIDSGVTSTTIPW